MEWQGQARSLAPCVFERAGAEMIIERDASCRGFEVFVDDVEVVSLLDMPRPFVKLRQLDLEKVARDVASLCAA